MTCVARQGLLTQADGAWLLGRPDLVFSRPVCRYVCVYACIFMCLCSDRKPFFVVYLYTLTWTCIHIDVYVYVVGGLFLYHVCMHAFMLMCMCIW
jgi:hypothetical protein